MSYEAKQRFLDLSVNEISVVDKPAIEVEFLVTKRIEEDQMEDMDQDVTVTAEKNETGAEIVSVDAPASNEDAAVNKALENVAAMVENIAKAVGVNAYSSAKDETQETAKSDEKKVSNEETTKAKTKAATPATLRALYEKQLKAAGVKGEAFEKAMSEFDEAAKTEKETTKNTEEESKVETEKSDKDHDAEAIKSLELLEQAINKAKTFTPGRIAQLKSISEQLQKLLSGVMEVPQGGSPKTSVPGVGMHGNASAVQQLTKSVERLTEAVTKSVEGQSQLSERVEAIEKARNPATALENEISETSETKKGFWTGVL